MPTITIYVAERGTPTVDKDGNPDTSFAGHIWYVKDDGRGNRASSGYTPIDEKHVLPIVEGGIRRDNKPKQASHRSFIVSGKTTVLIMSA